MGDDFLRSTVGTFQDIKEKSRNKDSEYPTPYAFEFYNMHPFDQITTGLGTEADTTMARMLNALDNALINRPRLPRFLIFIMDTNVLKDFDLEEDINPTKDFGKALTHFTKHVNVLVKRRRLQLEKIRPGAVYGDHPTIIHLKVLRRTAFYPPHTTIGRVCAIRARFNDALNKAAAEAGHLIMNMTQCNQIQDFDHRGRITQVGKEAFWLQVDELLEQFDLKKVKLLPTISSGAAHGTSKGKENRRKLPTPPATKYNFRD